ncbi:speckle-type POZ protein B-like [Nasonia vitripennis]|uniref:Uncharacterized protein n=1 Tax=Nasonia vitripennis TaxID=7425 RepID=A0A7M7LLY1_NASVI|nr:speckle-type POZ protein B-like [Nasonia vitripennis]
MCESENSTGLISVVKSTCKWEITDFYLSETVGQRLESPLFTTDEYQWQFWLYPKGYTQEHKDYMSLYIVARNASSVEMKYSLSILNQKNEKFFMLNFRKELFGPTENKGRHRFIKQELVTDVRNGLLVNNKLTILCEIVPDTTDYVEKHTEDVEPIRESEKKEEKQFVNLNKFEKLLNNQKFSDVKFVVNGGECHAHKCILAANSEVFAVMFEHDNHEPEPYVIEIKDISCNVFIEMLRFVYTGRVNDMDRIVKNLLTAADKYAIEDLKAFCEKNLGDRITTDNAVDYLNLADLYNADNLKTQAINFIISHGKEMIDKPEFKSIAHLHEDVIVQVFRNVFVK